jgi:hypothetical protein
VPVGGAARVEQVIDVIDRRAVLASDRAVAAARHRHHVLQGEEVVLRMRDIRVGPAVDVRYAEFAAHDFGSVHPGRRGDATLGEKRLPRGQHHERGQQQPPNRETYSREPLTHRDWLSSHTR